MTDQQWSLLFWCWYKFLATYMGKQQTKVKRWYWRNTDPKICALCGQPIGRKNRSIDHIIPVAVCRELGWFTLEYSTDNFQLAHKSCNITKAHKTHGLPPELQEAIDRRRKVLQEQAETDYNLK